MNVADNIRHIRETIAEAARRSGRPASAIRLMAVTKTVDDDRILAAIQAGVEIIGENYVQEAKTEDREAGKDGRMAPDRPPPDEQGEVRRPPLRHDPFRRSDGAGRRTRPARPGGRTGHPDPDRGQRRRGRNEKRRPSRPGPGSGPRVAPLENLSIRGLMTMPPWFDDPEEARPYFRTLRELRDRIAGEAIPRVEMQELSMGMTGDYAVAVEEGATIVRIGRGIFGETDTARTIETPIPLQTHRGPCRENLAAFAKDDAYLNAQTVVIHFDKGESTMNKGSILQTELRSLCDHLRRGRKIQRPDRQHGLSGHLGTPDRGGEHQQTELYPRVHPVEPAVCRLHPGGGDADDDDRPVRFQMRPGYRQVRAASRSGREKPAFLSSPIMPSPSSRRR